MYKIHVKIAKTGWREIVLWYMTKKRLKIRLEKGKLFGIILKKVIGKNFGWKIVIFWVNV